MPAIDAERLPDPRRGRRAGKRPGADAVEFARHQAAHVGPAGRGVHQHFRLVRYDRRGHGKSGVPEGPLHHGAARPRRARGARRARHREDQLVRAVDGRHGRHVARRQRAATRQQARSSPTPRPTSPDKDDVERPHQDRARERLGAIVGGTMERWFTKEFREREPQTGQEDRATMFLATKPEGYIACGEAVRDMDHREICCKRSRRRR